MKKLLFLFVFAITTAFTQAQNGELFSLMFHDMSENLGGTGNVIQQHDGDYVINYYLGMDSGSPYGPIFMGNVFYKVSSSALTVIDSLYLENSDASIYLYEAPKYLFASNPQGEGNIRANFEYDEDCDSSFLRISHFQDNNLISNPYEDIVVPVCDGHAYGSCNIVDCKGDLIIKYYKGPFPEFESNCYFVRISLDGTIKHQVVLPHNGLDNANLNVLSESPLKYYHWKGNDSYLTHLCIFVMDSLFNQNPIIINPILYEEVIDPYHTIREYFLIGGDTEVIPIGGDDIIVASRYVYDTTNLPVTAEYGVAVAKYNLRTMQQKGYIVFNDYPGGYYNQAYCLSLKMMTDGSVYLLYKEKGYPEESLIVVKMDTDLNMEWKHLYKTDNISISRLHFPTLYNNEQGEEKGIVWVGLGKETGTNNEGWVIFLLNHDGTVGTSGRGIEVRPYTFYPNPVKEQLLMDFSPDVQPTQVELYDLQGRLVRSQNKALESIDMSQLPAGTYTMRVSLEDGKSYSDKVVKD